ncbi:MAG TPA: hypothetical protein VK742_20320 [Candidatus Sulfotelmatobacter sp.]|jgi:hypothetical protein|nr:hypothetical protein [Candidatus Sulfotelmatobacter sp.]
MTKDVYQFDISRADKATALHQLTHDVQEDEMLDVAEKAELHELIRQKFGRLNREANPNSKPRW